MFLAWQESVIAAKQDRHKELVCKIVGEQKDGCNEEEKYIDHVAGSTVRRAECGRQDRIQDQRQNESSCGHDPGSDHAEAAVQDRCKKKNIT